MEAPPDLPRSRVIVRSILGDYEFAAWYQPLFVTLHQLQGIGEVFQYLIEDDDVERHAGNELRRIGRDEAAVSEVI
jgi:hypothetical protein